MAGFLLQFVGFSRPRGSWQNSIAVFLKNAFCVYEEEYTPKGSWVRRVNGCTVRASLFSDTAWMCNMCNISPRTASTFLEMPEQRNADVCFLLTEAGRRAGSVWSDSTDSDPKTCKTGVKAKRKKKKNRVKYCKRESATASV